MEVSRQRQVPWLAMMAAGCAALGLSFFVCGCDGSTREGDGVADQNPKLDNADKGEIEAPIETPTKASEANPQLAAANKKREKMRRRRAEADLQSLESAAELFRMEYGRWPDLVNPPVNAQALQEEPYLERLSPDPWGNEYICMVAGPGAHSPCPLP